MLKLQLFFLSGKVQRLPILGSFASYDKLKRLINSDRDDDWESYLEALQDQFYVNLVVLTICVTDLVT